MTFRLFALLLSLAAAWPAGAAIDPAAMIRLSASVLKVEAVTGEGAYSLGSAVVVAADRVVTNCHVTRGARRIAVLQSGLRLPAQPLRSDARHDLCLLSVPALEGAAVVELGQSDQLVVGQPLMAIGHTAGMLQRSVGQVLALHRMDGGRVVQSSNFFNSGASGGGLFDADARLVGILTFRLRGGQAHYFAVPAEWLARQLQAARQAPVAEAQPAGPPLAFWEEPLARQPWFLQAAVLERDGNWRALQPLALEWARREASDPEPWYFLGLALEGQARTADAVHALNCALAAEPAYENARVELQRLTQASPSFTALPATGRPCHL